MSFGVAEMCDFNNYDEQAFLNKLAGPIFRKYLINSVLQHQ